ncbi:MAG: BCD family MFS transporter [Sphingomonadaceae bacterium]
MSRPGLSWFGIARLGLVQASLGAIVMLVTSLLNRVMVVEQALPAALPAALVGFHYVIQLSRPRFGHGSDRGGARTPWIVGGMALLGLGALAATHAALLMGEALAPGLALAILAYAMIGAGVGACGTSLLALLATETAESRRPAAAAVTWMMMIAGIAITAGIAGQLLEPWSERRLAFVAGGVVAMAFLLTLVAILGIETRTNDPGHRQPATERGGFRAALLETWADPAARRLTIFIFIAMLAYSMQDMVLEPFSGLVFGYTPGQSTSLAGLQHGGVLAGMLAIGIFGTWLGRGRGLPLWVAAGCVGSAAALALLSAGALAGPGFPLKPAVFALGFFNGLFAVAAIGTMMSLAGAAGQGREGIRIGLWGAAQAIAFAAGGFLGAVGVDVGRALLASDASAFMAVFSAEALLFLVAATLALGLASPAASPRPFREMRA